MTGDDVLRDREELRPRVGPFLEAGEELDVVLRGSSGLVRAAESVLIAAWPFFRDRDKFLLVATDRRWLVLESAKAWFEGELHARASCDRAIRISTSWVRRFDGFDQPYAIDPTWELWSKAANDALDARAAGRSWDLAELAPQLTAEDGDGVAEALADGVMKVGRFIPRRRRTR